MIRRYAIDQIRKAVEESVLPEIHVYHEHHARELSDAVVDHLEALPAPEQLERKVWANKAVEDINTNNNLLLPSIFKFGPYKDATLVFPFTIIYREGHGGSDD